MKAFVIQGGFGMENLQLQERDTPRPGRGEVRLQMKAVSLNYRDYLMVTGAYNPKQPLPLVPCSDGVGIVDEVGPDVDRLQPGMRVATLFAPLWRGGRPDRQGIRTTLGGPLDGTLTEHMVVPEGAVVPVPEHLSHVEAATLTCAGLTAWSALVTQGGVTAGETVLVQGTGGVSLFALQFANLLGARVIVTSSKDDKLEKAKDLGAWQGINYIDDPHWGRTAKKLTGGVGVDHVVEVGGAGTLAQSCTAVRIGGCISLIGILAGPQADIALTPILMQNIRVQGIFVGHREGFEAMNRAVDQHRLQPVVDRVFPFEETREAFYYLSAARHMGKICIEF
ncbi:MAG: NAD(P)-dependent alcohol dehydrogenase [Thermoanaerobaculia bacterium]|nr:NAD(P)-dependent alcohol dehydrogenase [Thermoanaerobaculia bacterium]